MNKRLIRLTEQDLHRIVKESVNRILSEVEIVPNPNGHRAYAATEQPRSYRRGYRKGLEGAAWGDGHPNTIIRSAQDLKRQLEKKLEDISSSTYDDKGHNGEYQIQHSGQMGTNQYIVGLIKGLDEFIKKEIGDYNSWMDTHSLKTGSEL